ncbi:hypothetical protein LO763_11560 [Glycomyces sp. A-F 0318]|uniref:hypothetical protein n=1 Tax=Glycomyces amatae TaxID=2881355 RepID=UPI001E637EC2|nr:hypothetical protein [Glycomyces amatae]MCD0444258.1 hypothetical protein [Glycomyces amatae]
MGLIAVGSLKGRPGVTTTALALAICWPQEVLPTVVECDPSGGDIAANWRLHSRPGLTDVAAAAAEFGTGDPEAVEDGVQTITAGGVELRVVCAAPGGAGVRSALPTIAAPGAKILDRPGAWTVADCGRLDWGSAAWPIATAADATLLVVEGSLAGVAHLRSRAGDLRQAEALGARLAVAVAPGEYAAEEVADLLLAADVNLQVLGALGPAKPIGPDPLTWRRRHALKPWRALAQALLEVAEAPEQLAITDTSIEAER